jgi:hypothetical protein
VKSSEPFTPWAPSLRWDDDLAVAPARPIFKFIPCLPAKAHSLLMRFLKKLTNPFVLVAEGFVVGALMFATATPDLLESNPAAPPAALDSSVIPNPSR